MHSVHSKTVLYSESWEVAYEYCFSYHKYVNDLLKVHIVVFEKKN